MDCHDGNAVCGTGAALETEIETRTKCHTAQRGPFVYEHSAMREGCTACHNPHGTGGFTRFRGPLAYLAVEHGL